MAAAIRFRSAVALIGDFPVLAGVDLDVASGEIVLLRGPNGAGKTSLLRACAGLLPVSSGRAEVLGHDMVADRRSVRRQVGLLGHATSLYDDLTVEDNVRFAVRAAGGRRDTVTPSLERLGLAGRLGRVRVGQLSAGQRRRVALSILVARDPALWLLDEPHAGLDAAHRDVVDGLVQEAAARGKTVVFASHEQDRAVALTRRIVEMAGGHIIAAVEPTIGPASPPATISQPLPEPIHVA
ncbi:MAG TPA: heme ABC exporter ATP-binding protein CcmA [Acidimicrobiales bacterium]